ncbi:hypothetical protein FRC01_013128 [Tulasnella sp. 417]|nr:hypothetical protein FRC01_013128 [Tulasnella sp. 417]
MGADQSKPSEPSGKVFTNEQPVQFSQDLVDHLSDRITSTSPDSARQSTLDEHVRSRIQAELSRLQSEEEQVRQQIEAALEKENLDKETELANKGAEDGKPATSSSALAEELEEVQKRAERFLERKKMDDLPEVKEKQEALLKCYSNNRTTSLDCWREVEEFKQSVASLEKKFVDSLR